MFFESENLQLMGRKTKDAIPAYTKILIQLMDEKGMSIREAAKIAGVGHSTISSWRSGASPDNFVAVMKLAKALGVTFSYLLTGIDESRPNNPPNVSEVFNEGDFLFDGFAKITIQRLIPKKQD
jgi:transcriptional regulator with XRE-family HTH domain